MPLALLFTFRPETIWFWDVAPYHCSPQGMRRLQVGLQGVFWNTLAVTQLPRHAGDGYPQPRGDFMFASGSFHLCILGSRFRGKSNEGPPSSLAVFSVRIRQE